MSLLVICQTCGDECDSLADYEVHARCHQFGHAPQTNDNGDWWCDRCSQRLIDEHDTGEARPDMARDTLVRARTRIHEEGNDAFD